MLALAVFTYLPIALLEFRFLLIGQFKRFDDGLKQWLAFLFRYNEVFTLLCEEHPHERIYVLALLDGFLLRLAEGFLQFFLQRGFGFFCCILVLLQQCLAFRDVSFRHLNECLDEGLHHCCHLGDAVALSLLACLFYLPACVSYDLLSHIRIGGLEVCLMLLHLSLEHLLVFFLFLLHQAHLLGIFFFELLAFLCHPTLYLCQDDVLT